MSAGPPREPPRKGVLTSEWGQRNSSFRFVCPHSFVKVVLGSKARNFWEKSFHEPCSADIPVRGFTGHSCPVSVKRNRTLPPCRLATGKSPEPADRNVCVTPLHRRWFM